jgi:predicted O-methyltransferase YrrM
VSEDKHIASDQLRGLKRQPAVAVGDGSRLREVTAADITRMMASPEVIGEFEEVENIVAATGNIPGLQSSSKRPTQYGLYFLVRGINARSVLEVGTNLGCSAGFMGLALDRNQELGLGEPSRLVTVDYLDVNDETVNLWAKAGSPMSPAQFVEEIGCRDTIEFVTSRSLEYMKTCRETFDLIFLDGSHDACDVYQELPEALRLINDGGVVALHDYNPLYGAWEPNARRIPGPFFAVQRFLNEGTKFNVLPVIVPWWPNKDAPGPLNLVLLTKNE